MNNFLSNVQTHTDNIVLALVNKSEALIGRFQMCHREISLNQILKEQSNNLHSSPLKS